MYFSFAVFFVVLMLMTSATMLLIAPSFLRRGDVASGRPRGILRSLGTIELLAAVFLLIPQTRIWGVAATAGVTVPGTLILFTNRKLLWTVPCLAVLGALVPLALSP